MWNVDSRCTTELGHVAWGWAGSGPPLVLAHGWPWSSFSWHRVIPALAVRFRVYWYDMPGYGRSDPALDRPTGLDAQGRVLCALLDHWDLDRPAIVAHDFGGAVTLRAHLLHEREFERVVLMNVVALSPWGSAFFDHVGRHVEAFQGVPEHIHAAIVRAYIAGALAHPVDSVDLDGLVAPWLRPDGQGSFYRQFAQADERFTDEFEPLLARMRCPVHVLWGEDDPWIPIERGRRLGERLGVEILPLPGVGHLPQLEAPEQVGEALKRFLAATS
ncbi:alpha/beta fold hydrolase [Wenzhouxiangella sp. XN79A]|uniref:alpha/beta fold hydrolase n=1 Tax=Wenzhouxiangella sp. XN79A TaxID=2724193 RepID=UPI00144ADE8D|nr:alpha/beta fold hydrolase [Wenzhouxiangella sp. XN79A]NKI33585.1 alpha/beta fold hydrolase [Wenzhouxiangella sp. XN79A]